MNFSTLLSRLKAHEAAAPLVFEVDGQTIGAGYHITELRHSTSRGIDCGGSIETWQDARLQLLDGPGKTHMSVNKFSGILSKALAKLPELVDADLLIEFSPDNEGLHLMLLDELRAEEGEVVLTLRNSRAVCKPAERKAPNAITTSSCCGASNIAAACCS